PSNPWRFSSANRSDAFTPRKSAGCQSLAKQPSEFVVLGQAETLSCAVVSPEGKRRRQQQDRLCVGRQGLGHSSEVVADANAIGNTGPLPLNVRRYAVTV